jgi:hypothetical protein
VKPGKVVDTKKGCKLILMWKFYEENIHHCTA